MMKKLVTIAFAGVLLLGCTEDEKQQVLDLAKEALMSEEEKEARRQAEDKERLKAEMEEIHSARYDTVLQQADFEIRKMLATYLSEKGHSYSDIIVYDLSVKPNSNSRTPNDMHYYYKAQFSADIVTDEFLTQRTETVTGYLNFLFYGTNTDDYLTDGYKFEQINSRQDFHQRTKDAASHFISNLNNN